MELLNGKCKEDFEKYICNIRHIYESSLTSQKYALIIEWFDSVGIYISLNYHPISNSFSYFINYPDRFYSRITTFRKEATKQAIIKANDIYNNR